MAPKSSPQKNRYFRSRGKEDLLKKIQEKLLKVDPEDVEPEDVDPEVVWTAYGLGQLTCGKHSGGRNEQATNCKENPYCLGRLGLEQFEKLIKKSEDLRNEKMVESVRRDAMKQPCGLVNRGNFCYVNSFLQIWFNDPVFRQIIYDWRPSDAYVTPDAPAMDVQQVMNALQRLFFTLDTTPYEDASGAEFCKALRLNQLQQDAQEFTVKFFESIDRNLMKHPNGESTRDRIQERFNGVQTSSLRCKCGHHSDNTTKFSVLPLTIDGHTTLTGALKGYFADECLSDFSCSGCGQRGGVVSEKIIEHLPPVLLLSLNRYAYDSTTGRRKKLTTPLQYPRVLDVDGLPHREMLSEEESSYELSAVMVHESDSADCGHYWDIIRHPFSGDWFKYNDKHVKETKAPGVETEKETAPSKTNIDLKYCYGLVYRRKEGPMKQPRHPGEDICGKWTKEMEHKFYRMTDADAQASEITLEEVSARHRVVGDHMAALEVKPESACIRRAKDLAFLPTALLSDIINKEYARAEKMKRELHFIAEEVQFGEDECASQSESDLTSPQKRKTNARRRVKSMYDKRLAQVDMERFKPSPTSLVLCPHERISYESVLSGEAKAVNRAGAEKLCKDYGLKMMVVPNEGEKRKDQLRTCLELCAECVQEWARDVHFASRLDEDAALAMQISKDINTRCSVTAFATRPPPLASFYVAKSALTTFKRDAQRERSRKIVDPPRCWWAIGPSSGQVDRPVLRAAAAARAAVGETEKERRKRRKKEQREGEEEKQPVMKCARSDAEDGARTRKNGNGRRREEEEDGEARDASNDEEDNRPIIFNEALRCNHDGVHVSEFRRMLTEREWSRLSRHFTNSFEVWTTMEVCEECKNSDGNAATADKQAIVEGLNAAVGHILKAAKERGAAAAAAGGIAFGGYNFTRGVCSVFVEKARKVIHPYSKARMLPPLCQSCLVCDHGAPRYGTSPMGHRPFIVPLTRDEWERLRKEWAAAREAAGGARSADDAAAAFADLEIELCPISGAVISQCTPCYESLLQEEKQGKHVFDEQYVYVKMQADEQSTAKGGEKEAKEKAKKGGDKGNKDGSEEAQEVGPLETVTTAPSAAAAAAPSNGGRVVGAVTAGGRSSTRRGTSKGLIKVRMSSHETVKDLKIALIKHTNYAPVDQLLYSTAGGDLLDDELTLREAKVLPDNYDTPLILVVQSATDASLASPTNDKTRAGDGGFYDTALAH